MPFVNIKLVDGVFTSHQKHALAKAITGVMVKFEGSEAFRSVAWVLIEELHTDAWHIGANLFGATFNDGHARQTKEPSTK
ncbi:tautomerase family protein [Rhizobium sp. SIMBA_035]